MLKTISSVLGFFVLLWGCQRLGFFPIWLVWFHLIVSAVSLTLFAWDKLQAVRQKHRVAETTLLLSALVGGWPGAWLGRQLFRHKTQKKSFIQTLWGCTLLHALVLLLMLVYQLGML